MGGVAIVVFSDLVDSTALLARLGDDRMEQVRRAHIDDVSEAVEQAGGRLIKTLGDGAMASFESGLGALRAAAAIQAATERLDAVQGGIGIAARVGVAAGEPIADEGDLHGMAVVIASRLSAAAGSGEVLVQDLVGSLVASREGLELESTREYKLRGVPEPVRASQLLWRELGVPPAGAPSARGMEAMTAATTEDGGGLATRPEVPLPQTLAAYADEPLIGRDLEISALREMTVPRSGRRAVLILGEPGIGKTRHAAAAAAEAHADGALVALARCPPEPVVPFEPWVRAIGELARAGDEGWCVSLAEAAGPELAALVPELGRLAEGGEQATAGRVVVAEGARYRLLSGIGAVLACAAGNSPLHLVLDDAQWCDPASAQALAHLLEGTPVAELVLVVTARKGEMGRGHPVSRALSDLRRTGDLDEMPMSGLDPSGMAQLIGARLGRAITPAQSRRLQARTDGNPFFAGELARDLEARGALRDEHALETAPVPDAVTGLVEERLERLDASTERLLSAAAAIGPSASVSLAARAAGLGEEDAQRAVQEALAERLVDDVAAAEPTIAFTHALVREALISETGEAAGARLHLTIARALEKDPDAEPAELARHYGLSVDLAGPEPAIAAHRAAAAAAAGGHDHEQAAAQLRQVLALLPENDAAQRTAPLLELGEQELLSANLMRARESFRATAEAARNTNNAGALARAALGFSGGDVGFGWETGTDDPESIALLREGIEALGDSEPRLVLRMVFRLAYLMVFSDDDDTLEALVRRAGELERVLGDAEARVLAGFTVFTAKIARQPDPLDASKILAESQSIFELMGPAEDCGRQDLLLRFLELKATCHYLLAEIPQCEEALDRAGEIAARLGSPRFTWETDIHRGTRLLDRGEYEAGEALVRRASAVLGRLRPDIHVQVELYIRALAAWVYRGDIATTRLLGEGLAGTTPRGLDWAVNALAAALDGDLDTAQRQLTSLLDDWERLRRPDLYMPLVLCVLARTATLVGDREAGARLRPLLEPMRSHLIASPPAVFFGSLPEAFIGYLELLLDRPDAAVEELRTAVARADACELVWASALHRVDLATALHCQGAAEEAQSTLAEGEALAERYGVRWATMAAVEVRAEIEGREQPAARAAHSARVRPIRTLASRGGRRALAAIARDRSDAELERRFAEPRRQRALFKGMARGFQPAQAGGFSGVVVYELEPFAIEPPADSPWRWAIEADSRVGRARLLEPAPLDAAVTVHIGLADWVRVLAGLENALAILAAGRGRVEGDILVAARLEAMFGAG